VSDTDYAFERRSLTAKKQRTLELRAKAMHVSLVLGCGP
jgi:hypothetical protein